MSWKDPERKRAYMKEYSARPDQRAKRAAYQRAHPEINAAAQRRWAWRYPQAAMIMKARTNARRRGLEFTITMNDIAWVNHCPVLGIRLDYRRAAQKDHRSNLATLDRWDTAKGYVPGNVFVISWRANRLKWDGTVEELEAVARYARCGPS